MLPETKARQLQSWVERARLVGRTCPWWQSDYELCHPKELRHALLPYQLQFDLRRFLCDPGEGPPQGNLPLFNTGPWLEPPQRSVSHCTGLSSAPLKLRLPLLQERHHSLAEILGSEEGQELQKDMMHVVVKLL